VVAVSWVCIAAIAVPAWLLGTFCAWAILAT